MKTQTIWNQWTESGLPLATTSRFQEEELAAVTTAQALGKGWSL